MQERSLARRLEDAQRIVRIAARQLTDADGATFVLREGGECFSADEDAIRTRSRRLRPPEHLRTNTRVSVQVAAGGSSETR